MAWLVAMDGSLAGRKFLLDTPFSVGRGPDNQAVLDDVIISRQHARISPEANGHILYDLCSANGTYVNESLIAKHRLVPGDIVRFGPFRFRFEVDVESDAGQKSPRLVKMTRKGFEAPTRIVGALDASLVSRSDVVDVADADRRLRTLYRFVESISATLDQGDLADRIVQQLGDVFPAAELVVLFLPDASGQKMQPLRVHSRRSAEPIVGPLSDEWMEVVVRKRKATLSALASPQSDDGAESLATQMHAPLLVRGLTLGVLHVRSHVNHSLSEADLDLLRALAAHAAVTLHSVQMHLDSLKRERLAQDLALAQQIQKSFLPLELPRTETVHFFVDYEPAYSVGGDFYDVFWVDAHRIGILVGDVSGKGVSAALLMARVSSDLRAAMLRDGDPAAALAEVNRNLHTRNQPDIFVTAICLTIDVTTGVLSYSSAGHLPPYCLGVHGDLRVLDDGSSTALGVFDDTTYTTFSSSLDRKSAIVIYTDGIVEATNALGEQLGFERFREFLEEARMAHVPLGDGLLKQLRQFVGEAPQYDDITLLVVEWEGISRRSNRLCIQA